jgi:hypothetical protein
VPPVAVEVPLLVGPPVFAAVLDAPPVFFVPLSAVSTFVQPPVELPPPMGNVPRVCVSDVSNSTLPPQAANGRTEIIRHEATQLTTLFTGAKSARCLIIPIVYTQ